MGPSNGVAFIAKPSEVGARSCLMWSFLPPIIWRNQCYCDSVHPQNVCGGVKLGSEPANLTYI